MRRTYIISTLLVLAAALPVRAQNEISQAVEVEREYEGAVMDVVKSPIEPAVDDSLLNFKLNLDYTAFYSPYRDLYDFSPVLTAGPKAEGNVVYPWLYARVAAAYPWTPSADLYITPRFGERFSVGLYLNHDSYWGQVPQAVYAGSVMTYPGHKVNGDRMKNRGGLFMGYRWTRGEVNLDASYTGSRYALTPVDGYSGATLYNQFEHLKASLRVRSTNPDPNSFYYNAALGYRYFNDRHGVLEHLVDADASFGATIKGVHRLYVTFGGTFTGATAGNAFSSRGIWTVSPVYTWERDRWRIRAGLTLSSVYGDCIHKDGGGFLVYPDASVSFEAARNALWLYLKASGDNNLYTRYDLFALNPWMEDSGRAYQSAVPVSAEFGLNGLVRDRFSYSLGINYSMLSNSLSFMATSFNGLWYQEANLADSHVFGIAGMLKWQSPSFMAKAEFNYRGFSNPDAVLMTPAFDVDAVLEYNLRRRLFIRADCYFRTSTTGWSAASSAPVSVCRVPAFVDVGLRISYAVNTRLMVFVEGNNLANSKIQYFLNYVEPGINFGAGVCFKL